ncbi:hypothetical protein TorRG33x02_135280 [Trema orientale]|uniref:Uncharacterized protein n=1 Tax=Trema orientale TaxID=63057 RepID=A0A2P5EYQ6_TREOI|nr:hypothetical protein TorRG33x02_135280 [Trema orientale]
MGVPKPKNFSSSPSWKNQFGGIPPPLRQPPLSSQSLLRSRPSFLDSSLRIGGEQNSGLWIWAFDGDAFNL